MPGNRQHNQSRLPFETENDEFITRSSDHVREMLDAGKSPSVILAQLVAAAETAEGSDTTVSILVLDKQGLLRNGASPKLPADYLRAIDGLKPNPLVGTCAAAAATGAVVMTPDFCADDKWNELRHWPLSLGFVGAWSQPIKSRSGKILGTFGTYYRTHRTPTPQEREKVELLAHAAALAIAAG